MPNTTTTLSTMPVVEQAKRIAAEQFSSGYELLSTKLTPPHPSTSLIARDALYARLDQGLGAKLTLLSAPAGFGKTTLVADWSATRSTSGIMSPVAWVSLDVGDNDPIRFWRYVIVACQRFDEGIGSSALALLQSSQSLPFQSPQISYEAVLTALLNDMIQLATPSVLILDDYHVITSEHIHSALDVFLDHLPANMHVMLLTRNDPPLSLTRLRAHGDLVELHTADLRFSCDETQTFVQHAFPFSLEAEAITQLHQRTEGWMAGLNLLALALYGHTDVQEREHFLATFNGSHRHILDYLISDVFNAQSETVQMFLLQTSSLSRLSASLCNAVTERNDSDRILREMERANLFLEPLDSAGQWFRYHTLFAEALQHEAHSRLGEIALRLSAIRASDWYTEHGLIAEAVEAALTGQDHARVITLLNSLIGPQHSVPQQHYFSMGKWLAALPKSVISAEPSLCFVYAMFLTFSDYHSRANTPELEEVLQMAEDGFRAEGNMSRLGELYAFRALLCMWREDISAAAAFANQSLEWLPDDYTMWLSMSIAALSWEQQHAGMLDNARQLLLKARILSERAGNSHATRPLSLALVENYFQQGDLRQSDATCRQVLPEAENDPPDRAKALEYLGQLAYEWNDLNAAERNAQQALRLSQQINDKFFETRAALLLLRISHARGQLAQAQRMLHTLIAEMQPYIPPLLYRQLLIWQARFSLESGDLFAAQRWWSTARQEQTTSLAQQEQEELLAARLLIAQGSPALDLLNKWQLSAREGRRTRSELEIQLLMTRAYVADNQSRMARQILQQVLILTQAENYQRLFLDEGEVIAALLRGMLPEIDDPTLISYMQGLLRAFGPAKGSSEIVETSAIEPLSPQEERVLRLFATGHSREEIASELVVSVNTVKTHLQRVYRKLNVTSRQQARQVAHHLYLL